MARPKRCLSLWLELQAHACIGEVHHYIGLVLRKLSLKNLHDRLVSLLSMLSLRHVIQHKADGKVLSIFASLALAALNEISIVLNEVKDHVVVFVS